jgi:hypothetical protein
MYPQIQENRILYFFDRFKWRSCLINRTDKTILKRFMLVSFCFLPFYYAFSTHHFTVSNETIITSCVSQVVFGDPLLFLSCSIISLSSKAVLISFSVSYFHCIGFIKLVRATSIQNIYLLFCTSPAWHQ